MYLTHQELQHQARTYELNWDHIGPASVDVRLDPRIIMKHYNLERWVADGTIMEQHIVMEEDTIFTFIPGNFYLCSTVEKFSILHHQMAFLFMRSGIAREGATHNMAGLIDPGFGVPRALPLTLEITVVLPVTVLFHDRIAQVAVANLTKATDAPYTGSYVDQEGPTESRRYFPM